MNSRLRNEKITAFVRDVLGCGCPDEVFNKIEVSNIELDPDMAAATRIVIGDTLLIYILPDHAIEVVAGNLGKLITLGKQDRDSHSYNRFRLVVSCSDNKGLEEQVSTMFSITAAGDEKLHIHFLAPEELPQFPTL